MTGDGITAIMWILTGCAVFAHWMQVVKPKGRKWHQLALDAWCMVVLWPMYLTVFALTWLQAGIEYWHERMK